MRCKDCENKKEKRTFEDLLLDKCNECDHCSKIKSHIERFSMISVSRYETLIISSVIKITPIYCDSKMVVVNAKQVEVYDYNARDYLKSICKIYGFCGLSLEKKEEKYRYLNGFIGLVYDEFYKECGGQKEEILVMLLSVLEYNRFLTLGLILWLMKGKNIIDNKSAALDIILQTLYMVKNMAKHVGDISLLTNYEELYCKFENLFALDKMALEYGIEALEYKKDVMCNGLSHKKVINIERIIQMLRAIAVLNYYKIELTEGRLKNCILQIDDEGDFLFDNIMPDYSIEYVNEMQKRSPEDIYEEYESAINKILKSYKGFDLADIRKIMYVIQDKCSIGDEFLVGDEESWIYCIMNACECEYKTATQIMREFVFEINKEKIFSERTRNESRAMRKSIFKYGDEYISVVNLLTYALGNWMLYTVSGEVSDKKLKSKLQKIYNKIDLYFEESVYTNLKNSLKVKTIRKNITPEEIRDEDGNINLPGEIDVLLYFCETIFVIECKNIDLKSDPKASANEYSKLIKRNKGSFQDKLSRKVAAIEKNKKNVLKYLGTEEDYSIVKRVAGVIVVKSFTDACINKSEGFEVVMANDICEWIEKRVIMDK